MKEKLAGTILLCAVVPLFIFGYLFIVFVGLFISVARVRQGVRAMDHFVNATIFNGYAWESVATDACVKGDKKWVKLVKKITEFIQKDHCKRANKREQPIVDLMLQKGLDKQSIGK